MAEPIRISVTLSGGASLGAFHAGASAALLTALAHLREEEGLDAQVDALGGASAGAIVALTAGHALMEGIDPVWLLHDLWVERVSLGFLRARGGRAPLTLDRMRTRAGDLLDPRDGDGRPAHRVARQEAGVVLHVALTGLRGLTYRIGERRGDLTDSGSTYVDWIRHELRPGGGVDQLLTPEGRAPVDAVIASASHPGGFAPGLLDRRPDRQDYGEQGVEDLPESGRLWYTDGGLLQNEPLGRVLEAAPADDRDVRRLHLMIDPRSEGPQAAGRWADPERPPTWAEGLSRAMAILPAQALYDDLRRVERDNDRLQRCAEVADALAPHVDGDTLRALGAAREDDPRAALRTILERLAGVDGKRRVTVDVVSPLLLAEERGEDVAEMLAGDIVGDFGGFLTRELRASDFALGFEAGLAWLRRGLPALDVEEEVARRAADAALRRRPASFDEVARGRAGLAQLPWRARLGAVRLVLRYLRVLARETLPG